VIALFEGNLAGFSPLTSIFLFSLFLYNNCRYFISFIAAIFIIKANGC
jgi:hypothetical protein